MKTLRLGTRGSVLARTQSQHVREALEGGGDLRVELEIIRTSGDLYQDRPLPEIGGKGLFTRELDRALLDGAIDLAVHSLKDLPTETPDGLLLAAVPLREDPRDVLIGREGQGSALAALAPGSVVGTSSLRRQALTLAFRSDLEVRPIRGNLDTRIRKVEEGDFDAIVVAAAGVLRLGMKERVGEWLERTAWLPAPGQGALALVARKDDAAVRAALETLDDAASRAAVVAERSLLRALGGGCQMPIAALGLPFDGGLRLWGLVASPDGARLVRSDRTGSIDDPEGLGDEVAEILRERGAREILARLEPEDVPGLTHP
ncbi:MAG: hydroxymethylbilane synthase [Gemmatimonadetes bacterium]|nr:hydroxymethylbilane synthase [Gemmatimonadota bacterium]NIR79925.1 hydroxymethylbilane synthase [Gemmatimonadota bacterium]NIT88644.1 hydroxymethylbilane synthase [Gemmatimonadota bacterium]NIU32459.1 hydroxymethylbilane synthase [Gemmatimonadota bacterium]NIU36952.1 hydroxymethylbilane synthase [Gemmatimonadota bacterium]